MPLTTRSSRIEFPDALTVLEDPVVCTAHPSIQSAAKFIQEGGVEGEAATISGGRLYNTMNAVDFENEVCVLPP